MVGLDGAQPPAQALAGLPQQPERDGGRSLRSGTLRISPVLLDEMGLQGRGYFIRRLQRLIDGQVPCGVINHPASIARRISWGQRAKARCQSPRRLVEQFHDIQPAQRRSPVPLAQSLRDLALNGWPPEHGQDPGKAQPAEGLRPLAAPDGRRPVAMIIVPGRLGLGRLEDEHT